MSNKTIYDFEPYYDNYECWQQYWIDGIYGFRCVLKMCMPDEKATAFVNQYCKIHKCKNPLGPPEEEW